MAHDAPSSYVNPKDSETTVSKPVKDTTLQKLVNNQRYMRERIAGPSLSAGETRQIYAHDHGESITVDNSTGGEGGLTIRRSLANISFRSGVTDSAVTTCTTTWKDTGWRVRAYVGPFRFLAVEMRYKVSANAVRFRADRYKWVDSANATTLTAGLQEQTADKNETSFTWHTIDGQAYSTGAAAYTGTDTKLMPLEAATGPTTLGELVQPMELRIYVQTASGTATVSTSDLHLFEVTSADDGGILT